MVIQKLDDISFKLKEKQDFSWIKDYGNVFSVIDETGSGCILFGVEKDDKKYFFKIAGAKTVEAEVSCEESIKLLKDAVQKAQGVKTELSLKLKCQVKVGAESPSFSFCASDFGDFSAWNDFLPAFLNIIKILSKFILAV